MLKLAAVAFPHTMLWGGNVWGSRTEVQAKRPDPTKKAYALRGRSQAALSWRWNSNSKAVGDPPRLTAFPSSPRPYRAPNPSNGTGKGCRTGSEAAVPVLPLKHPTGKHTTRQGLSPLCIELSVVRKRSCGDAGDAKDGAEGASPGSSA